MKQRLLDHLEFLYAALRGENFLENAETAIFFYAKKHRAVNEELEEICKQGKEKYKDIQLEGYAQVMLWSLEDHEK